MNRVLVTGAAGFIGGHLLERLLSMGIEARGVDDMSHGHPELLPEAVADAIYERDVADADTLRAVSVCDVVFHLAAVPRVSFSVENPLETHVQNYDKTIRLIEAIRQLPAEKRPRLVFASSSSVYGGAVKLPAEEHSVRAFCQASPYAMQKFQCEQALRMYNELYDIDCVSLRFFNVFGPRALGDSAYATAVAAWFDAVRRGAPLRSDGDGSQTRDMCYVSNVVDACVLAGSRQEPFSGDAYNVGCGQSVSNAQILKWFRERFADAVIESAPRRAGDVMHTLADISMARAELGYEPAVSFWEGLELTAEWHKTAKLGGSVRA